jgi:hypothetical protein
MDYETNKPRRPRRLGTIIAAGAATVISLGFLGTGATLLWADSEGDRQGYITTDTERFSTGSRALATENLDLDLDGPESLIDDGELGKLRVRAESNDGKPVFVGIARTSQVEDYLRGTAHDIVTDVDFDDPFDADYDASAGDRKPALPAQQDFWAASAHGPGERALTWGVDDGEWSVVVMNADGSRGVDAGVSAGVRLSWLDEAAIISLSTGALMLLLAGGLVYLAARPQRPDDPKPLEPRSLAGNASTTSSSGAQ